jgi:glucose/mannose-6-phosphate isomerase
LNFENIKKYDTQKIYEVYNQWPDIAYDAYENNYVSSDFKNIDHIIFSGMGGSGTVGDFFASILSKTNIHVTVVKGYVLPKTVDANTLIITTSISGNTSETLSILKDASTKTPNIISFSDGGKMETFCKSNKILHQNIPKIHSPRASFSRILYSMLKTLDYLLPITTTDVYDSLHQLKSLKNKIGTDNTTSENPSINLAEWIKGLPVIYYPFGFQSSAIRFKNSLQENAKIHVVTEDIIEACHNGIVGWEKKSSAQPILIQGIDDNIQTKARWMILKEFFNNNNIDFYEISSISSNILSKLIHLSYMFDFTTIYLALNNKIDPTPVKSIDYIKSKLLDY